MFEITDKLGLKANVPTANARCGKDLRQSITVKPVLSGHSKIDKTKVLKTNGSLMRLKVLQNHKVIIGLENQFLVFFFSGRLRQVLLYILYGDQT